MSEAEDLRRLKALIEKKSRSKPAVPIVKVPDLSPAVLKQSKETEKLAIQAIASMRDSVNNNQAMMGEVVKVLMVRPIRFDVERDRKGDMVRIIPIYE